MHFSETLENKRPLLGIYILGISKIKQLIMNAPLPISTCIDSDITCLEYLTISVSILFINKSVIMTTENIKKLASIL